MKINLSFFSVHFSYMLLIRITISKYLYDDAGKIKVGLKKSGWREACCWLNGVWKNPIYFKRLFAKQI